MCLIALAYRAHPEFELVIAALAERTPAADADLPDTGVGLDLERMLSPACIVSPACGTRCTTVAALRRDGSARFTEWRFNPSGELSGRTDARWALEPGSRP